MARPREKPQSAIPARTRKRRIIISLLIGGAAVFLVGLLTATGTLAQLERHLLDFRFRHFAYFNPRPSDRIIHVDIDDRALSTVGKWPWGREVIAEVVDELKTAGAKVVAFDVLFTEPQEARYLPSGEVTEQGVPLGDELDGDGLLAQSLARSGNVLLPVDLGVSPNYTGLKHQVRTLLRHDVALDRAQIAERLSLDLSEQRELQQVLSELKASVVREKLQALFAERGGNLTQDDARAAILPKLAEHVDDPLQLSPDLSILSDEYNRIAALHALSGELPPAPPAAREFGEGGAPAVPVLRLAEQSQGTGFVTFRHETDGVVRTVPLWLTSGGRMYPHLSLAAACEYLHVPIPALQVTESETIIPAAQLPDGSIRDVRIPMLRRRGGDGWFADAGLVLIPWQTNAHSWEYLFDAESLEPRQHVPIAKLVELSRLREAVLYNERQADEALLTLMLQPILAAQFPDEKLEQFQQLSSHVDQQAREARHDEFAAAIHEKFAAERAAVRQEALKTIQATAKDPALSAEIAGFLRNGLAVYEDAVENADRARRTIGQGEASLRVQLRGTICLVGWTATASIADFVPTSLHARTPGVMVYGALLNSIFTGHFIARQDLWLDLLLVVGVGLACVIIATFFSPLVAIGLTALALGWYFLMNGLVLFDYMDVWANAAGPLLAGITGWAGITVYRLGAEQQDRARITRQFKNYVAPDLVDYLVENPHVVKLEGDNREMTCIFTDFAGFTALSNQLGPEGTVKVLNQYLGIATDRLMEYRGTVNKYLGDGILAFWNAPIDNPLHALDACRSVLAVLESMRELERSGNLEGLPKLSMRVGITTGVMTVGDFGAPPRRSDYTIIGDTVNLASRLEQANKQFGTGVLISARTFELVKEEMLCRPIGRIVVVGRKEAEPVYELLATHAAATEQHRQLAAATADALEAYFNGDFQHAIDLFTALSTNFGPTKLADRYIAQCRAYLAEAPDEPFDGALVLTEK